MSSKCTVPHRLRSAACLLALTFCLAGASPPVADNGGGSSGGTTTSKITGLTIDTSTFEEQITPQEEFPDDIAATQLILARLGERIPGLPTLMEPVFSEPVWWSTKQDLGERTADSKITDPQEKLMLQDSLSVVVNSAKFRAKKPGVRSESLLHEGVRFVAIQRKLNLDDRVIQFITRIIQTMDKSPSDVVLRDRLVKAGFPKFPTHSEIATYESRMDEFLEKVCPESVIRKQVAAGISEDYRKQAEELARAVTQSMPPDGPDEVWLTSNEKLPLRQTDSGCGFFITWSNSQTSELYNVAANLQNAQTPCVVDGSKGHSWSDQEPCIKAKADTLNGKTLTQYRAEAVSLIQGSCENVRKNHKYIQDALDRESTRRAALAATAKLTDTGRAPQGSRAAAVHNKADKPGSAEATEKQDMQAQKKAAGVP